LPFADKADYASLSKCLNLVGSKPTAVSRFTADAVRIVDQHNVLGKQPQIEMWPDNRTEV